MQNYYRNARIVVSKCYMLSYGRVEGAKIVRFKNDRTKWDLSKWIARESHCINDTDIAPSEASLWHRNFFFLLLLWRCSFLVRKILLYSAEHVFSLRPLILYALTEFCYWSIIQDTVEDVGFLTNVQDLIRNVPPAPPVTRATQICDSPPISRLCKMTVITLEGWYQNFTCFLTGALKA